MQDFYSNLGDLTAPMRHQPGVNLVDTIITSPKGALKPLTSSYRLTGTDSDSDEESGK